MRFFYFIQLLIKEYQNIDLLAFICVYKRHYKNSIIHNPSELVVYKIAKKIGCSSKKVNKYFKLLNDNNLLNKRGKSYQIVSIGTCINVLLNKEKQGYYLRFFTHLKSKEYILPITAKCKEYKALIEQELTKLNFNSQLHKQYVESHNTKHCLKKGVVLTEQSKMNFGAKTGAYQLSSIIGCCTSTAQRRLKKWHENKLIVRQIIKEDTININLQNLPNSLKKYKDIVRNAKSIYVGSLITNFSKLGCSIKAESRKSKDCFDILKRVQQTNKIGRAHV